MIRARRNDLLIFGITDENNRRMEIDQPIYFPLDQYGLKGMKVLIFRGKTEDEMAEKLKKEGFFTPATTVIRSKKLDEHKPEDES